MGHAFDGIGFAIVEVDRADDQGDEDHHRLHRGHCHLERLAGVEGHGLHHRHGQDHGGQRSAQRDVHHRLHAIGEGRAQGGEDFRCGGDGGHQDCRDHRRRTRAFQSQVEGLGHDFGQGADHHHAKHQRADGKRQADGFRLVFHRLFLAAFFRIAVAEEVTVRPDLHAQEQGVKHDHRADGKGRIHFPALAGNELRHHHRYPHGGENHHAVSARRIVVVSLLAMLDPAHQRREPEDAVDVEHHRRVDRVPHQRRRSLVAHHDRQDHHLHQYRRQRQDHGAVRITDLFRQQFGVMGHAHGCRDDETDQDQAASQRHHLPAAQQPVLQRIGDTRGDQRQQQQFFLLEQSEHRGPVTVGGVMSY